MGTLCTYVRNVWKINVEFDQLISVFVESARDDQSTRKSETANRRVLSGDKSTEDLLSASTYEAEVSAAMT
ncbi:hypothetical protein NECAME_10740 [Necator americanus]|uniref:Uncharacterized protein n=1 Tax=Necator americanus TaxID=51031 RepID=W2T757_NECAM|nr:hypothetical protein NECAME_10740 [Necator americanus]ETN77840.1 hypothetical protein NECAME_10740 [Necator americanus]